MNYYKLVLIVVLIILAYLFGKYTGDPNSESKYGNTGLPSNCRALIKENLSGFANDKYTSTEALYSIDRNCGPQGFLWGKQ